MTDCYPLLHVHLNGLEETGTESGHLGLPGGGGQGRRGGKELLLNMQVSLLRGKKKRRCPVETS